MKNISLQQVVFDKCVVYDRTLISEIIADAAMILGVSSGLHGKTVLLKPNLISAGGPDLACTHSEFIAGAAIWLLELGAKVLLGDSPAFGSSGRVCEKQSITAALSGLDLRFVEFTTPLQKKLQCGRTITVAHEALDCDLFVGLPKVKAHNQMYVTLAVKNIFGIVKGVNKAKLHMTTGNSHEHFSQILLDLVRLLPPHLHLMDGIHAMHESGPLDGSELPLHCVAASRCPVALDSAILELLELDNTKSPLWRTARKREYAGSFTDNLVYPRLLPSHFHQSGFVAPESLDPVRFSAVRFLSGMFKRMGLAVRS